MKAVSQQVVMLHVDSLSKKELKTHRFCYVHGEKSLLIVKVIVPLQAFTEKGEGEGCFYSLWMAWTLYKKDWDESIDCM